MRHTPFLIPPTTLPFSCFFSFLIVLLRRPSIRLSFRSSVCRRRRPVLNKRAKRYARNALRAPLNHGRLGEGGKYDTIYFSRAVARVIIHSFDAMEEKLRRWPVPLVLLFLSSFHELSCLFSTVVPRVVVFNPSPRAKDDHIFRYKVFSSSKLFLIATTCKISSYLAVI